MIWERECAIFDRVVWEVLSKKVTFFYLNKVKKQALWTLGGRAFQAEGMDVQRS